MGKNRESDKIHMRNYRRSMWKRKNRSPILSIWELSERKGFLFGEILIPRIVEDQGEDFPKLYNLNSGIIHSINLNGLFKIRKEDIPFGGKGRDSLVEKMECPICQNWISWNEGWQSYICEGCHSRYEIWRDWRMR